MQDHLAAAREALLKVQQACKETCSSSELKQVLAALLATGNCLNFGTKRGAAAAIKLDMLAKLADMKVPPKTTSLHDQCWLNVSHTCECWMPVVCSMHGLKVCRPQGSSASFIVWLPIWLVSCRWRTRHERQLQKLLAWWIGKCPATCCSSWPGCAPSKARTAPQHLS